MEMFPKDSVIRRVSAEPALFLGAGRALLLQLAHPSVAQGVADHSDFQHNPFKRLLGTLEATLSVVFGSKDLADGVGRRIGWIHDHVTGPTYRANDPENLLWVHATLLDTALVCHERFVGPLSPGDLAEYYDEMAVVAEVFGCPRSEQPADIEAFRLYFDEMVHKIEVTDVGRSLATDIVRPKLPGRLDIPLAPALALHRLVAIGTTPEPLRQRFGFRWTSRQDRALDCFERAAAAVTRWTPRPARVAPGALTTRALMRQARRHLAAFEARSGDRQAATSGSRE